MKLINHVLHKHSSLLFWQFFVIKLLILDFFYWLFRLRWFKLFWKNWRIHNTWDNATIDDAKKPSRIVFPVHFMKLKALSLSWGEPDLTKRQLFFLFLSQLSLLVHDCVIDRHNLRMNLRKCSVKISWELISFVIIRKIVYHYFLY